MKRHPRPEAQKISGLTFARCVFGSCQVGCCLKRVGDEVLQEEEVDVLERSHTALQMYQIPYKLYIAL